MDADERKAQLKKLNAQATQAKQVKVQEEGKTESEQRPKGAAKAA